MSGLGRGLGSLIPNKKINPVILDDGMVIDELTGKREMVSEIPVEKITPNPHQPRKNFNEDSLQGLMESIKEYGIIQPIILFKDGPDSWQLIAGERRWRSAKALGIKTVPAIVRDLSEQKRMEIALIENLQRENLNVLEVAAAYQKLIDEFNLTQEQLSKRVGKSRPVITNTIRILTAREEVHQAIRDGKISDSHARVLAGLPEEDQLELLKRILEDKMSSSQTEKASREIVIKKKIRPVHFDPEVRAKEEELEKSLGTKVEIKKSGGSGQIIIKFFSDEEFREIIDKIL